MNIEVTVREVYGAPNIYPVNDAATAFECISLLQKDRQSSDTAKIDVAVHIARQRAAALRAALAAEPQPVAWLRWEWNCTGQKHLQFDPPPDPMPMAFEARGMRYFPLYTAAPTAQPLTDEQREALHRELRKLGYTTNSQTAEVIEVCMAAFMRPRT